MVVVFPFVPVMPTSLPDRRPDATSISESTLPARPSRVVAGDSRGSV